jgi:hypothetical protein
MSRRLVLGSAITAFFAAIACSNGDDSGLGIASDDGGGSDAQIGSGPDGASPISDAGASTDAHPSGDAASGPSGCAGKTYKICEDFESSTVGNTPTGWTVLNGYGSTPPTSVVASDVFHSGTHSLKTSSAVSGASRVQKSFAGLS